MMGLGSMGSGPKSVGTGMKPSPGVKDFPDGPRMSTCQDGSHGPAWEVGSQGARVSRRGPLGLPAHSCPRSSLRPAAGSCGCPAGPPGPWGSRTPAAAAAPPWPLASGCLPREPAGFVPHPALDWSLGLPPPHPTAFGFLSVRDPNLLAKGRQAHSGTRGSQSPLPGPAPLCPLPRGRGKPGAPLGARSPNPFPAEEAKVGAL